MDTNMDLVNLMLAAKELSGNYGNVVVARMNDHVARISSMTEPYFWHLHPNSDETFLGLEGTVILEMEDRRIDLMPGHAITVPKGVKHRTAPAGSRSVNLTIERADTVTIRVEGR